MRHLQLMPSSDMLAETEHSHGNLGPATEDAAVPSRQTEVL